MPLHHHDCLHHSFVIPLLSRFLSQTTAREHKSARPSPIRQVYRRPRRRSRRQQPQRRCNYLTILPSPPMTRHQLEYCTPPASQLKRANCCLVGAAPDCHAASAIRSACKTACSVESCPSVPVVVTRAGMGNMGWVDGPVIQLACHTVLVTAETPLRC